MKSMTGFGKASYADDRFEVEIEVKSLNHRFLDMRILLPREVQSLELPLRDIVGKSIGRGKVDVRVTWRDKRLPQIEIDEDRLKAVWTMFEQAQRIVGQSQEISLDRILDRPGVVREYSQQTEDDELLAAIRQPLEEALSRHAAMSRREGEAMHDFFITSLARIDSALSGIEAEFPEYRNDLFNKYKTQVSEMLASSLSDEEHRRLLVEIALFVEKSDVNEEIVRLHDHIAKFRDKIFETKRQVGKALNFILQEMQRETNTIGAKFNSVKVFSEVLTMKEEIEKCREMVQNVE
ncbi:MAG: YicC family protein [Candidatus Cloacimonetes bacterium]|nr:YicC family protein [Candidatus Cloacimonadota bacterium]